MAVEPQWSQSTQRANGGKYCYDNYRDRNPLRTLWLDIFL